MKWDKVERAGALTYVVFSLVSSYATLLSSGQYWHYELGRALDTCGIYLFFSGPLLIALTAVSAQRRMRWFATFGHSIPDAAIAAKGAWIRYGVLAAATHALVMIYAASIAIRNDAFLALNSQPFQRQFLLIVTVAAFGAFIGSRVRSIVVPGALLVLGILVALLITPLGLRPFMLAGAGTFDYAFQDYRTEAIVLSISAAVGWVLLSFPRRGLTTGMKSGIFVTANALLCCALIIMVSGTAYTLQPANRSSHCQIDDRPVCGPGIMDEAVMQVATVTPQVVHALPAQARALAPKQFVLVAPGLPSADPGAVEYESTMKTDAEAVARNVIATVSGSNACPQGVPDADLQSSIIGRATIMGWLQKRLDVDLDGSYPSDTVSALTSMPETQQDKVVTELMTQSWACAGIDLHGLGLA